MDLIKWLEENRERFARISDQIWEFAELGYQEAQSARLQADVLEGEGFFVQRGVAGIPTAIAASYGTEAPVIALLGEYDALPGLSQDRVPYRKPIVDGGGGHGCGHNLLGVGALAAAMAVKEAIEAGDARGTIRYYGCPAEENGSGKAYMVKAGAFNDVDLSLTWHPSMFNGCISANMLANRKVFFCFRGRSAHAAVDPHRGRSALDAVELMNVGVNYLREHIIPEARIHYVITDGGGTAPNVVPDHAESMYLVRAPQQHQLAEIYERVVNVAKGAATMTGTEVEVRFHAGASNMLLNDTIVDLLYDTLVSVGPPSFTEEERQFAGQLSTTFPQGDIGERAALFGPWAEEVKQRMEGAVLFQGLLPKIKLDTALPGSSDVGDVSWVTPTGELWTTCHALGTPGHSWQSVAQGGMSIGHKGMIYAAKALGQAAVEFLKQPDLLQRAREEFEDRRAGTEYIPSIPDGVDPPIERRS